METLVKTETSLAERLAVKDQQLLCDAVAQVPMRRIRTRRKYSLFKRAYQVSAGAAILGITCTAGLFFGILAYLASNVFIAPVIGTGLISSALTGVMSTIGVIFGSLLIPVILWAVIFGRKHKKRRTIQI